MKYITTYLLLLLATCQVMAQDTLITERDTIITNPSNIEVDQVEVIKAFEAKLSDAKKISVLPKVKTVIPVDKSYKYDVTIVPIEITYPDPIIKPLAMGSDEPHKVDRAFARLGYGTPSAPYGDLSYQANRGDEYDFLISAHHYGADDTDKVKNRKFSETSLGINGGYRIGENHKITFDFDGVYDNRFLYDTLFGRVLLDSTDISRDILDIGVRVGFGSIETSENGLSYQSYINGGYLDFNQRVDASEVRFGGGLSVSKKISSNFTVGLLVDAQTYNLNFTVENPLQYLITAKPGIRARVGNFTLKAYADLFVDNNGFLPFVEAEAAYSILDNSLQIYAGVDQKTQSNSLHEKYQANPFVSALATEQRNTIAKQFYGGLRGQVREFLTYNVTAGYEDIKDQRFDRNEIGIFMRQTFDDMTNFYINANVEFSVNEKLTVGGLINQNFFNPETLTNAINLPSYTYNAYTKLSLLDQKLQLRADIHLADQIFWRTVVTEELITGNKQLDVSLGFDFFVTKNIGLWAQANNLLDREYTRYHYYPSIGRNFLGGILIKF